MTTSRTTSTINYAAAPFAALSRWTDRGLEALWLTAVVAVPLAFLDRDLIWSEALIAYFEVPKVALLRTLTALMAVLWLLQWGLNSRFPYYPITGERPLALRVGAWPAGLRRWLGRQPTNWLVLAAWFFLGSTLITTVLSTSFGVSLWGEVPGQDGFYTYTTLAYLVLFGCIASRLKTRAQLARLLGAVVLAGVLFSGYAALQHYGHDFLDALEESGGIGASRVTGTTGNAVFAAAFMLLTVSVSLAVGTLTLSRTLDRGDPGRRSQDWTINLALLGCWTLIITVQLLGLIFTLSRGSWIGTILAFVAFLALGAIFAGWRVVARALLLLGLSGLLIQLALQPAVIISLLGGTAQFWTFLSLAALVALLGILGTLRFSEEIDRWWVSLSQEGRLAPVLRHGALVKGIVAVALSLGLLAGLLAVQSRIAGPTDGPAGDSATSQIQERFASISGQVRSGSFSNRGPIWRGSLKLAREHPWFSFDQLSLPWLRPLIGYGPDMFRYTYLLVSEPADRTYLPVEPDHAHNYFIHHLVEQGFLGLASSLGLFLAPLGAGLYLLIYRGRDYPLSYKLLLCGLLATLAGRFFEQMAGVARVSDLTMFWALLGLFVALPTAALAPKPETAPAATPSRRPPNPRPGRRAAPAQSTPGNVDWQLLVRLSLVAWIVGGIVSLTWVKTFNYYRAAQSAAESVRTFQQEGDYQGSLSAMDRAIALAPDVLIYYSGKAAIYAAYLQNDRVAPEPECSLELNQVPYDDCLVQKHYWASRAQVQQRPFSWRARLDLANSTLALGRDDEAIRRYRELVEMAPTSWPLRNRLAEAYMTIERPDLAMETLRVSLSLTGETSVASSQAKNLRELAQSQLNSREEPTANP